jgi:hypothetical protein
MAKKLHAKKIAGKYKSFKLQGSYTNKQLAFWIVADLIIGFVLGFMLQPTIVLLATSYAAGNMH